MYTPRASDSLRLFVPASALLLCFGCLRPASSQVPNFTGQVPVTERAPDPPAYVRRAAPDGRPGERPRQAANTLPKAALGTRPDEKLEVVEHSIKQGNESRGRNDYEKALDYYQKAQSLAPKEPRAFYGMGNIYTDLSCHDSAVESYLKALELKKDHVEALVGLGYAYFGKERYDDAERQFSKALELKRNSADAHIGLGWVYTMRAKYEEAAAQINLVINDKSAPVKDRASAHVALGGAYWRQGKRQDAVAQLEEAIRLKPDLAWAYVQLGNAQAFIAYSKLPTFTSVSELDVQELEALRAAEKRATDTLEDAKKYNYNHPNLREFIAIAFAYQFRYRDAIGLLDDYFTEVTKLEALISPRVTKCGDGFKRLKAEGHWYKGFVYFLEGLFEEDARRKNELFDKAAGQFNEAISTKEDYAAAYRDIGHIYTLQGKKEAAVGYFTKALRYSTQESAAAGIYQAMATTYASLGRYDAAVSSIEEAIRRDPKNPSVYESLASVYVGQGKLEETIVQLKKARGLRAELKVEGDANPHPYYYLGSSYVIRYMRKDDESDFNEAVKALNEAIKIRPKFAMAYNALGVAYEKHRDADEALANYKKAAEIDPKNPEHVANMAYVYYFLKNNDDAAAGLYKQALGLKPDYARAHWQLALVYHRKKDAAEAVKHLLEAIKYDPKFVQSYLDLAHIYRTHKDYPAAVKYLTAAIEIEPTNPLPYRRMGLLCYERADADGALANFKRAVEYDPKNPVNYVNMASAYSELKRDDDAAIKELLRALEVDPKSVDAYSSLADIYRRRKDYPTAVKYLMTAIGISPSIPWMYKDLAKVNEAQGKIEDAIRYYEEAIQRLDVGDMSTKSLYLGRIERVRGNYAKAVSLFQKVDPTALPGQTIYEVGVVHVVSKNKKAALEQYQQLVETKSPLAEELLAKINEMK